LTGKHLLCKQTYASSNLVISTQRGNSLVVPSPRAVLALEAQMAVQPPVERKVAGSSPVRGAYVYHREEQHGAGDHVLDR
jgi:hypothetical protein